MESKTAKKNVRKPWLSANLVLLFASLFFCFLALLMAEGVCRVVCEAPFLGNSRNLFVANAFGESTGNTPNAKAVSFGVDVYMDGYGFRVPPEGDAKKPANSPALLVLGDSVGFGTGVEENEIAAGRLRLDHPSIRIYNSSVIGYNTGDYKAVIDHFLPGHDEIRGVVMHFCLNDVDAISARNINAELEKPQQQNRVMWARTLPVIRQLNDYLRSRSKLYITLKNTLTDPSLRYWRVDAQFYEVPDAVLLPHLQPIADIDSILKERGIPFVVIVSPYEAQLREGIEGAGVPQRRLTEFFEAKGIDFLDIRPRFRQAEEGTRKLFLAGDPMHYSPAGHRIVEEIISETLGGWKRSGAWQTPGDGS
jgi:hypothetical protein